MPGFRGVEADQALACDIGECIEFENLLIGGCSLIQLFEPCEDIPPSNPCPYILAVECDGSVEICLGFIQVVPVVGGLRLLRECERDELEIGLPSHNQWIDVAIVKSGGVGSELDLIPQIGSVESSLEQRAGSLLRGGIPVWIDGQHSDADRLLLKLLQLRT